MDLFTDPWKNPANTMVSQRSRLLREILVLYALYVAPGLSAFWTGAPSAPAPGRDLLPTAVFLTAFMLLVGYLIDADLAELRSVDGGAKQRLPVTMYVLWALFGAVLLGAAALGLSSVFRTPASGAASPFSRAPAGTAEVSATVVFLVIAAAAEETFFRAYLIPRLRLLSRSTVAAVIVSAVSFSLGHIYQGTTGTVYAVIAGIILGALWVRFHGLPMVISAHALYNVATFLLSNA